MPDAISQDNLLPPVPDSWWNGGLDAALRQNMESAIALDATLSLNRKRDGHTPNNREGGE